MTRDDIYFNPPDTYIRQKPEWTQDIDKHIKAFLKKGGKITQCEPGEGVYAKRYEDGTAVRHFVIKRGKE